MLMAVVLCLAGCAGSPKIPADIGQPTPELSGKLQQFFTVKERQARELAELDKKLPPSNERLTVAPEVWPYFAAARKGEWRKVTQLYFSMSAHSYQFDHLSSAKDWASLVWQPVNETYRAYEQLCAADPKYILAYGNEIIDSIPPGSVFFAGTDAGRFVTTLLAKSQITGDPVFIVSQNALTDGLYLSYLRSMHEGKIHIPTADESSKVWEDYLDGLRQRMKDNRLMPGEDAKLVNGRVQINGRVAVIGINALLTKAVFDKNPARDFFLDEQFQIDWPYPRLVPHGFIFKINREPLAELGQDILQKDRGFWNSHVAKALGNWLNENTSVKEICEFADKTYVRKDLSGFSGDPQFVQTARMWKPMRDFVGASAVYSKSRANIANLYAWWAQNAAKLGERERMAKEADFAFRQALALCPYQSDTVGRYVNFLFQEKRFDESVMIARVALKFNSDNKEFQEWVKQVEASAEKSKTK